AILESGIQAVFTAEDTFTIADDGIHFVAQGGHVRNAFAQTTSELVELCITVEFQLVKFGQVSRFNLAVGVLRANVTIGADIALTGHHLNRTTAGQSGGLKAALQFLAHVAQSVATHTRIRDQAHQALQAFFENAAVHQQFAEEVDEFVELGQRYAHAEVAARHLLHPCRAHTCQICIDHVFSDRLLQYDGLAGLNIRLKLFIHDMSQGRLFAQDLIVAFAQQLHCRRALAARALLVDKHIQGFSRIQNNTKYGRRDWNSFFHHAIKQVFRDMAKVGNGTKAHHTSRTFKGVRCASYPLNGFEIGRSIFKAGYKHTDRLQVFFR